MKILKEERKRRQTQSRALAKIRLMVEEAMAKLSLIEMLLVEMQNHERDDAE